MDATTSHQQLPCAAALALAGLPVGVADFGAWCTAAQDLLARRVPPHAVHWLEQRGPLSLASIDALAPLRLALLEHAACCPVPDRWALLYRVLWCWRFGHRLSGADAARLQALAAQGQQAVQASLARLRFRERRVQAGPPRFLAWCRTEHDVLVPMARHLTTHMRAVSWMVATPEAGVLFDGMQLHAMGGLDAPACRRLYAPRQLEQDLLPCAAAPATLDACCLCRRGCSAGAPVEGSGPVPARIMLVGEQPGRAEQEGGAPFLGASGKLLDRVLAAAALPRRTLYLSYALKHGPVRSNKAPAQGELDACRYWLLRELDAVRPKVVVALGSAALKAVLGAPHAMLGEVQGKQLVHEGRWVLPTYHPASVLRLANKEARSAAFGRMADTMRKARHLGGLLSREDSCTDIKARSAWCTHLKSH